MTWDNYIYKISVKLPNKNGWQTHTHTCCFPSVFGCLIFVCWWCCYLKSPCIFVYTTFPSRWRSPLPLVLVYHGPVSKSPPFGSGDRHLLSLRCIWYGFHMVLIIRELLRFWSMGDHFGDFRGVDLGVQPTQRCFNTPNWNTHPFGNLHQQALISRDSFL